MESDYYVFFLSRYVTIYFGIRAFSINFNTMALLLRHSKRNKLGRTWNFEIPNIQEFRASVHKRVTRTFVYRFDTFTFLVTAVLVSIRQERWDYYFFVLLCVVYNQGSRLRINIKHLRCSITAFMKNVYRTAYMPRYFSFIWTFYLAFSSMNVCCWKQESEPP